MNNFITIVKINRIFINYLKTIFLFEKLYLKKKNIILINRNLLNILLLFLS